MTSVPNDSGNPQEELKPKNTKAMIILVTIIVIIIIGAVIAVVLKLNKTDTTTSNFLATADSVKSGEVDQEITMTAKKFEFSPNEIKVKQGERVRLKINASDAEHGFSLPAYNIDETLPMGEETIIEFIADQKGTFDFNCSVFCGSGHSDMTGTLIVE